MRPERRLLVEDPRVSPRQQEFRGNQFANGTANAGANQNRARQEVTRPDNDQADNRECGEDERLPSHERFPMETLRIEVVRF